MYILVFSEAESVAKHGNSTIAYDQSTKPYHTLIAEVIASGIVSPDECKILDVGCGNGNTLKEISALVSNARYTVADVDPTCIEICKELPNVESGLLIDKTTDITSIIDDKFDVVVYSHVLQYELDPLSAIDSLISLMNEDAMLIVVVSNAITPTKILNNILKKNYTVGSFTWDRPTIHNFLNRFRMIDIIDWRYDYCPIPIIYKYPFGKKIGSIVSRILPWLSFSILVVCKRVTTSEPLVADSV